MKADNWLGWFLVSIALAVAAGEIMQADFDFASNRKALRIAEKAERQRAALAVSGPPRQWINNGRMRIDLLSIISQDSRIEYDVDEIDPSDERPVSHIVRYRIDCNQHSIASQRDGRWSVPRAIAPAQLDEEAIVETQCG
ncbi:hypothetical protein BH10PSE17_BH10PSE17_01470 [soil metagenome]